MKPQIVLTWESSGETYALVLEDNKPKLYVELYDFAGRPYWVRIHEEGNHSAAQLVLDAIDQARETP